MAELVDRDQEHLKLLKLGFYVLAGTAGFSTLFSLVFIGLGILVAFAATAPAKVSPGNDPRVMGRVFVGLGVGSSSSVRQEPG